MRYKILSVFGALAAMTACADLTSINQNPNGPLDVPPPSILPSVIQTVVGNVNGVTSLNIRGGGLWVQYYSEIQYRDEDKYIVRSGTSGGWNIYNGMLADLAQANTEIDLAGFGFPKGDLMYGGKMIRWKRFANSLRLRLAIHLSKVDAAKAASEATAAVAAGVFVSDSDNAQLMYLATSPNRNPIYNDARGRDDYGMSKTFVDSLKSWNDPRLPIFAQLNKDTIVANRTYQGLPNGLNDGEGTNLFYISRIGAFWRETASAPMHLLTYSEVL